MKKTPVFKWLFLFFFLLGFLWMTIIPPFQGADESAHFGQSKLWGMAIMNGFSITETLEKDCSSALTPLLAKHRAATLRFNPLSSYAAPLESTPRQLYYPYDHGCHSLNPMGLYYASGALVLALTSWDADVSFYALRFWSLLLFMGSLWVAFKMSEWLFADPKERVFFLLLMGLQPLYFITNVSVNYDGMLNLWFVVAFWIAFSFLLGKGPFRKFSRFLIAAIAVSLLAIFTKITGAILPIFFLLAALMGQKRSWVGLGALGVVGLFGVWALMTVAHYSFPLDGVKAFFGGDVLSNLYRLFVERPLVLLESFWGGWGFGWLDTYAPPIFVILFGLLTFGGLLGALFLWRSKVVRYCLLTLLLFEGVAILYNLPTASQGIDFSYIQGRYYYPLMIPFLLVLIQGFKKWIPEKYFYRFMGIVIGFFVLYHFFYLGMIIIPRFYF